MDDGAPMTGPAVPVADARRAVRAELADLAGESQDASAGALVLVACSGGADSLALAAAAAFVAPRLGLRAGAVVVDHGLQEGSAAVSARAEQTCRDLGLDPVRVVRVTVDGAGGPEAAARAARYAALEACAVDLGADVVLLGHTLDDQAEQVLLGLARGSGARSLAGMPARRGPFRRPFLGLRRADTEAVCAALGLEPWHDPTNGPVPGRSPGRGPSSGVGSGPDSGPGPGPDVELPLRSRVRHEVLPVLEAVLGPGVAAALARTAEQLREDDDVLAAAADVLLDDARLAAVRRGEVVLDVEALAPAPPAVRRRALRLALVAAGCPAGALTREHVMRVDALLTDWHGQGVVALPGEVGALRRCGRLELRAERPGRSGSAVRRVDEPPTEEL